MALIFVVAVSILVAVIIAKRKEAEEKHTRELFRLQHNSDIDFQPSMIVQEASTTINADVKGTYYRTTDEISAARMCEVGDTLILVPEPSNTADSYAVKVITMEGVHIGYISSEFSKIVSSNITHVSECIITRVTAHNIPFISVKIVFSQSFVQQPEITPKAYQCGPEDKMRNLSTTNINAYDYRKVGLLVQDLYERDKDVIAKARLCRKGDKIILKKGVCDELYPDRIDIYLADETYLGYAAAFCRKEVYTLFDKIVDSFVDFPITPDTGDQLSIRVIFPARVKCPESCLPAAGIEHFYSGNFPEVKMASELRRTDPLAALDILLPIAMKEKGIDAHLECVACYFQIKDWDNRIKMIQETLDRIESFTEDDYPQSTLNILHRYEEKLCKQLEFSQKRLDSQNKLTK